MEQPAGGGDFRGGDCRRGNAVIAVVNGQLQRDIEIQRSTATQNLEKSKAESGRILEMIKTGDPEKAAINLAFLLETGLIETPTVVTQVRTYLAARKSGAGPSLPAATPPTSAGYEFSPTASLTASVATALETSLHDYVVFLSSIGFPIEKTNVKIAVKNLGDTLAHYYPSSNVIEIYTPVASDIDVPRFILTDSIIEKYSMGAFTGNYAARSIEYGLAFYLPCSFANRPTLARVTAIARKLPTPFVRNLDNDRPFTQQASIDTDEEARVAAEVWGGAFWDIRNRVGQQLADQILAVASRSTSRPVSMKDLPTKFIEALLSATKASASDKEERQVREVFHRREFPIKN
jgi:hypothetical protein